MDRRVRRTRMTLYEALVSLILKRGYDAITMEDILAEADVGRSTFYSHFRSKDDLLARSLERIQGELLDGADPHAPLSLGAFFRHADRHREIPAALAGSRGETIVRNAMTAMLERLLNDRLPPAPATCAPRALIIRHIVDTLLTVTSWWLEKSPETSADDAEALFWSVIAGAPEAAYVQSGLQRAA